MDSILDEIARKIAEISKKRYMLAESLQKTDDLGFSKLKQKITDESIGNTRIVGVDGGFLKKEYHGACLILRRAVAVCFEFKNSKLVNTNYFPNPKPIPESVIIGTEFSESEFNLYASLKREEIELETAIEAVEKFKPDILIRDGSIVLYPSNLPEQSSKVYKTYLDVIKLFKNLYELCEKNNTLLCGAIEDSKGKRYCNLLSKEIIPNLLQAKIPMDVGEQIFASKEVLANTTDTLFLYNFLDVGERTTIFDYASYEIPILKDLSDYASKIFAFYVKAASFDRPLRIDFLASTERLQETAGKIASIIYAISKQNRMYSYPSVLIEADARAKLTEIEIEHFKAAIAEKLGRNPVLFELRRELRPF